MTVNPNGIPPFSALPLHSSKPYLSAWGLYGESDSLGTLNRLTPARVLAAAKEEIRIGVRISTDSSLNQHTRSGVAYFNRMAFHQEIIHHHPGIVNDDVWIFNSQTCSQWDGLRHYGYQKEERYVLSCTMF